MGADRPAKPGCRGCPIGCREPSPAKGRDRLGDYARLWNLEPDQPGLAAVVAEYHRRCDDLGLEAFETARAIALARWAGALGQEPEAVLEALREADQGTELGRVIGSGAASAARFFGLAEPAGTGPQKHSGASPEETAFLDTAGLCGPAYPRLAGNAAAWRALAEMLGAKYGHDFEPAQLAGCGRELTELEADWNRRADRGRKENEGR